ncbi:unnamed protein product [Darwinula stevensoni]|uniref:Uncharacterized protein n=1 Tax=Darwinula stevensoni TaxID=69355 RepID=A0A7R8X7H5_9CRUS|nr:unnamed protein product [Darwinula stevensoni]CAG0887011.1 unnamed protein product [Darwinula stevensoni]
MFSGPCNGLELNLYLNASDRPPNMQPSLSGVRVVIHRPDSLPSPEEEGFHASAGFLTNVALREMEISRLAYPYENECYNSWDQCGFYPINSSFIQYDSVLCRRMCMQATMVKACKCKLPFVQDYFTFANGTLDGTRPCNILSYDSQDMSCLISTFDDLNGGSTTCPCNAECQQTAYQQTISSAEWPAQMYKMDAMGSMALGSQLKKGESATKGEVVKLVIYFSSMVRENVVEYPSVTSVSLLSTLGGALSLYLGISLVMFVEVIEILPLMILAFLGKFFGLGRKSVANPELKKRVPRRRSDTMTKNVFHPVKNVLDEFYSTTQINGISNASRATHPFRKFIWWVITVVAAVATIHGILDVIRMYLQYSVSTTVSVTQPKTLTFPAVTICNLSPFPCSKVMDLNDGGVLAQILGCLSRNETSPRGNETAFGEVDSSKGGVRVDIHRPDSLPSPEESGFHASAGFITNIALREVNVLRLAFPYENECYSSWDDSGYYPTNTDLIAYSSVMCKRMFLQAYMVKRCKCKLPLIQEYFTFSNGTLDEVHVCDFRQNDTSDFLCTWKVFTELTMGNVTIPCNAECESKEYRRTISSAVWPTDNYIRDAMTSMALGPQMDGKELDKMKAGVVKLVIYFEEMVKETVSEFPSITSSSLFSTLGGSLSLYLGISLVMFLEILEILPLLVLASLRRRFGFGQNFKENPLPGKRVPSLTEGEGKPTIPAWAAKHN